MSADINRTNRVGGVVSLITLALCILIFAFRLGGHPEIERFLGILFLQSKSFLRDLKENNHILTD